MNVYNFNHLFYFYVTARLEGVTVAAKYLRTSQSSLSTQIKTLEATLGRTLFKKSGRHITLTDDGREVFSYCRRAFGIFDEMFDHLRADASSRGIRVTLGVSMEIERPFIAEVVANVIREGYKKTAPLIHLTSRPVEQMFDRLRIGEVDLLLATKVLIDREIEVLTELKFPVAAYASPAFLRKQEVGKFTFDSTEVPLLLPSKRLVLRSETDSFLLKRRIKSRVVFESDVLSALSRAATKGLGVALLPVPYVNREEKFQRLIRIGPQVLWTHRIILVGMRSRLEKDRRAFAKTFAQHLQSAVSVN